MKRKLQIFVSSTYTDLIEERQIATQAILDAGHIPAGMELFKAGKSQMQTIRRWIDDSDIYMLILGGRYGSIDPESGVSYTELEYQYAISKNMPVFAIVLSEHFLYQKAAALGQNAVFEKENLTQYNAFKTFVMSKTVKQIDSIHAIEPIIHATINDMQKDDEYHLSGWVRDDNSADYESMTAEALLSSHEKIIRAILSRKYLQPVCESMSNFSKDLSCRLDHIIASPEGIFHSVERTVRIELLKPDSDDLLITVTRYFKYLYVPPDYPFFVGCWAEERQAKTFKTLSFLIDGIDHTGDLQMTIKKDSARGQFPYFVSSNKMVLENPESQIAHVVSYECPALEFFQSSRLSGLCKHFRVDIILGPGVRERYKLICSTFSPFSPIHYDDFKAGEVLKLYDERIQLPTWSLPGSGYVAILQKISHTR